MKVCPSRYAIALFVTLVPLAISKAQQPSCDRDKTPNDCLSKLRMPSTGEVGEHVTAATAKAGEEIKKGVDAQPTGTAAAVAGSGIAIKDFLPRLATALAIPGLTADTKALGLRFNVKPNDPVWKLPFALQLESIANEGSVYEPLIANVPDKVRANVRDSLKKSLGDFDDLQFGGALNWESLRFGRSFRTHRVHARAHRFADPRRRTRVRRLRNARRTRRGRSCDRRGPGRRARLSTRGHAAALLSRRVRPLRELISLIGLMHPITQ